MKVSVFSNILRIPQYYEGVFAWIDSFEGIRFKIEDNYLNLDYVEDWCKMKLLDWENLVMKKFHSFPHTILWPMDWYGSSRNHTVLNNFLKIRSKITIFWWSYSWLTVTLCHFRGLLINIVVVMIMNMTMNVRFSSLVTHVLFLLPTKLNNYFSKIYQFE